MPKKAKVYKSNTSRKKGTSFSLKNNGFVVMMSSIMGDSPQSVHKENFGFDPAGRSTPPPTTSYLASKQLEVPQPVPNPPPLPEDAAALQEQKKEDGKEGKDDDFNRPDANPGYKPDTEQKEKKGDGKDGGGGGGKGGGGDKDDGPKNKMNGLDKLDGQWVPPVDEKADDAEDDSCIVNCLYYTLQCCECTIT